MSMSELVTFPEEALRESDDTLDIEPEVDLSGESWEAARLARRSY